MATVAALPTSLRQKLEDAARHVRRRRAVRGSSLLLLTLVVLGGTALLADAAFDLAAGVRLALLIGWLCAGAVAALVTLCLPLTRRLDLDALAAVVEEKYPDLGERLTTAVELCGERAAHHGSPALIALLIEETEARTSRLDFLQAVPARHGRRLAVGAVIALLLALIPAFFWPASYQELAGRFLLPWRTAGSSILYGLEVTPGDIYAARGRPVTLSAVLQAKRDGAKLPDQAVLVWTDAEGKRQQQRMRADRDDAFSFRIDKVEGDFTYHVEAGRTVSDTFRITAVEPPQLRADSPTITVTPPEYAKAAFEEQTLHGFAELTALQHGRIRFDLAFTHPVVSASLECTATNGSKKNQTKRFLSLDLSADCLGAHLDMPAKESGTYRIVAIAEHDIRTEWEARPLTVQIDQPPVFVKVAGVAAPKAGDEGLRVVLPYDSIALEISLADDLAVDRADLEYRINAGPVMTEAIPLEGKGARQATARLAFQLADKALKEDDEVHYRLRAADNRHVPEAGLGPHVVHYPPERWLRLKVAKQAEPLRQQEIAAQRDDLNAKLEAIKEDLRKEKSALEQLRQETKEQPALRPEQAQAIKDRRKENRDVESALRELARDAAETPALQPIAEKAQDVADQEMRRSDQAMQEAGKPSKPGERNQRLKDAGNELASALRRLDELREANDQLAQARLDQLKLELAAQRQQQLADRAAELAAKDPVKEQAGQEQAEQLKRQQGELADDLKNLSEQSEPLRRALDAANAAKTQQLSDRARELAQAQRDLAQAAQETDRKEKVEQLAGLAKKQQELADKADRLADETRPATQAARSSPLKPEDARKAAEALKQGDAGEALQRQDQSAKELDRLAGELDKAINLARDPREAARQLARLQDALQKRLTDETQKSDAVPLKERMQPLRREQEAISRAAEKLSVPPQNQAAVEAKKEATQRGGEAAEALDKQDPRQATARMEQARRALEQLGNVLPSLDQRRQQAQADVDRLRKKQDEIARDAEQAAKKIDKEYPPGQRKDEQLALRLADAAKRQADAAEQLSRLDTPNQEASRQRAQEALNRALDNLMDGKTPDMAASQQEARRQLERLERALGGKKPDDEPARADAKPAGDKPNASAQQLAKDQRELAQATEKAQKQAATLSGEQGQTSQREALERLSKQQQKLNQQAAGLPADQEQKTLQQARSLMDQARESLAKNDADRALRKQREAADALDRMAKKNAERPAAAGTPPQGDQKEPATVQGLPSKQQTEQARQLAKEQREIRDEVERLTRRQPQATPEANPLGDLARQQQDIARGAGELARNVGQEQGAQAEPTQQAQQAARSTQQAAGQMQAGSPQRAQQSGQQAAQQFRQLAQQLAQTPRGKTADPQAPDAVPQARQLAQRQEELNRKLADLVKDAQAQRAQQEARQEDLRLQSGELMNELNQLAKQMNRPPQARQSVQQAAESSQKAQRSMEQAQRECKQCNQGGMAQAQQQAAQSLDKAAQQASQAGQGMASGPGSQPQGSPQTGQSIQKAQGQMGQAQSQLGQGQTQGAQSSMGRAAQALHEAARQLSQQTGPSKVATQPSFAGATPEGRPDWSLLGPDLKQYAGKRWGELPGSLQTKIIQDMQKKYGDDYARVIKLYFEQLADTKKGD